MSTAIHTESMESIVGRLSADPNKGLSAELVKAKLEKDGLNKLPEGKKPNRLLQFLNQFANPIVLTLLVAAIIAVIEGGSSARASESFLLRYGDAIAIGLIVVLNAVLGFYQEQRAEAALDALEKMQTPNARVLRDGKALVIPASELVEGDIIDLEAGDAVPADARLIHAVNLASEEASLTGEAMPVGKDALAILPADAPLGDRATMVFVGTSIVRGKGRALVVSTGPRTEIGRLDHLIREAAEDRKTPLEDKLDRFGKRLLWGCLALSGLLFLRGFQRGDRGWSELLLEAVSVAVAAIPEGLPAITTITLALGMQRLAKRGAIVRKLAAVETLGAATVICSDKTGTLTKNEMTVREAYAGGEHFVVTGVGYDPRGELKYRDGAHVDHPKKPLRHLIEIVALCNNASIERSREGVWSAIGDPTEAALLTLAEKAGIPRESVIPSHHLLREVPFDSDRRRMTILTLDAKGREVAHIKGSADTLLPLCTELDTENGHEHLDEAGRTAILAEAERMSTQALRVLAVARRVVRVPGERTDESPDSIDIEHKLTFVGLVGMIDPPREGVKEAIATCAAAKVRAVMITGDHKLTACAIAKELGLWEEGALALTGAEVTAMGVEKLAAIIDDVRVFARVTAEQKLEIVRAFKKKGHVVAMTGDGVNDAPALQEAHIGVAMGKGGTDVARQAADMVIADDNFATIVHAVREGRAIYRNIQKFIFFLLSSNAGLIVAVFVASFLKGPKPLTPLMILWINLVTNGLPALGLGVEPPDEAQMTEAPRKANSGLLERRELIGISLVGIWMGGCALACYLLPWGHSADTGVEQARAIAFSLLAISPLFHAFSCRSPIRSIFTLRPFITIPLLVSVVVSLAIHLVAVLVPSLRPVFRTFPLTSSEWLLMLALSISIIPVMEVSKFIERAFLTKPEAPTRS